MNQFFQSSFWTARRRTSKMENNPTTPSLNLLTVRMCYNLFTHSVIYSRFLRSRQLGCRHQSSDWGSHQGSLSRMHHFYFSTTLLGIFSYSLPPTKTPFIISSSWIFLRTNFSKTFDTQHKLATYSTVLLIQGFQMF